MKILTLTPEPKMLEAGVYLPTAGPGVRGLDHVSAHFVVGRLQAGLPVTIDMRENIICFPLK